MVSLQVNLSLEANLLCMYDAQLRVDVSVAVLVGLQQVNMIVAGPSLSLVMFVCLFFPLWCR